jgi:hypothetical protein
MTAVGHVKQAAPESLDDRLSEVIVKVEHYLEQLVYFVVEDILPEPNRWRIARDSFLAGSASPPKSPDIRLEARNLPCFVRGLDD